MNTSGLKKHNHVHGVVQKTVSFPQHTPGKIAEYPIRNGDPSMSHLRRQCFWLIIPIVALLLSGCAGRTLVKQRTLEDLRSQNSTMKERAQTLDARNDELQKQVETYRDTVATLRNQLNNAKQRVDKLSKRTSKQEKKIQDLLTEKKQRVGDLETQNEQLEAKLSKIKQAKTRREGRNVVLNLQSRILFDLGEYELKPEARETLKSVAEVLAQYPERPVAVEGHTDTVPVIPGAPYPSNLHLSAYRAVSVVRFLTKQTGLNRDRFRAVGYGAQQPLKPNTSPETRRLNRRVELVLYPPELESKTVKPSFLKSQ